MNDTLYQTIFKRKSFHLFRNTGTGRLTSDDLDSKDEYVKIAEYTTEQRSRA